MTPPTTTQLSWITAQLRATPAVTDLLADGEFSVWSEQAPDGAPLPAVIITMQAPTATIGAVPTDQVAHAISWIVKAVAEQDSYGGDLEDLAAAITVALHGRRGAAPGGRGEILGSVFLEPFALTERTASVKYRHLGGVFRLVSHPPPPA